MVNYGRQRSTVKPGKIEITDAKVFVYSDIAAWEVDGKIEYEFGLVEYGKDEYIQKQNETLESEITNLQLALCQIYEGM